MKPIKEKKIKGTEELKRCSICHLKTLELILRCQNCSYIPPKTIMKKKKLTCKCECHTEGWGGETHQGYFVDSCGCEQKSMKPTIKGESAINFIHPLWTFKKVKGGYVGKMKDKWWNKLMKPIKGKKDWEKRFDKKFVLDMVLYNWHPVKHFISTLLEQQKKEIGKEFKKWFLNSANEPIEDAIERILKVKV